MSCFCSRSSAPGFPTTISSTDNRAPRFFAPPATKVTRNLVVASSYGFELFPRLQVGVAPFRSSEQTGAFLAVQAAAASQLPDVEDLRSQLQPLRFEVGRTYPDRKSTRLNTSHLVISYA